MSRDITLDYGTNPYDVWVRKDWLVRRLDEELATDPSWLARARDGGGQFRLVNLVVTGGPNEHDYLYFRIEP